GPAGSVRRARSPLEDPRVGRSVPAGGGRHHVGTVALAPSPAHISPGCTGAHRLWPVRRGGRGPGPPGHPLDRRDGHGTAGTPTPGVPRPQGRLLRPWPTGPTGGRGSRSPRPGGRRVLDD